MASEPKLAALHLPLVFQELGCFFLFTSQERGVFLLTRATLLDATESQEAQKNNEDDDGADDDTTLGSSRQSFPVVSNAARVLNLLEN